MKKFTYALLLTMLVCLTAGCGSSDDADADTSTGQGEATEDTADSDTSSENEESPEEESAEEATVTASQTHIIAIEIEDHGTITVALDADHAPITVENFINLVEDGFYDGLTFHRIIDGFMMQGGDPLGDGTGGSDEKITGEFSSNGIDNPLSHTRGAISMARSQDMDSASSQFFIVHEDSLYLDGEYAVFGYVTDGMDIVDEICENTPVEDGNGSVDATNQPVITSIKLLEAGE